MKTVREHLDTDPQEKFSARNAGGKEVALCPESFRYDEPDAMTLIDAPIVREVITDEEAKALGE